MEIFAWGANSHGQLGLGTCNELELPQIVPLSEPLVLSGASGGGGHTILVSTDGELYVSGWNNKGQLGIGTTEDVNKFSGNYVNTIDLTGFAKGVYFLSLSGENGTVNKKVVVK